MNTPLLPNGIVVSSDLSATDKESIRIFFQGADHPSHFNNPAWAELAEPYKKHLFVRFYENGRLTAIATVYTRMSLCTVHFGPMVEELKRLDYYLAQLVRYLRENKFGLLFLEVKSDREIDTSSFSKKGAWNTILISLEGRTSQDIFQTFSKGHRSAIKKAYKEGLEARFISDSALLEQLAKIYDDMHFRKGLVLPLPDSKASFCKIAEEKLGVVIGIFKQDQLVGGIICVSEGQSLLYKFGATDFMQHHLPILHIAIFEMIKYALKTNHITVDLCGFTPNAKSGSYASGINTFKKGFGGEVVEFSRSYIVKLNFVKATYLAFALIMIRIIPSYILRLIYKVRLR